MQRVTAAVVTYNAAGLAGLLENARRSLGDIPWVIHDSGSSDGTCRMLRSRMPGCDLICGVNRGFGYGNNRCLERIGTEYTLFLNSDASLDREALEKLAAFLDENPDHAAVQPLVRLMGWGMVTASRGVFLTPAGEAWDSGFMHLETGPSTMPERVPAVTAAVSLWRTEVLRELGGFDEGFFMYFEDADLSLRAGASGWKLSVLPSAEAFHMVGGSSSRKAASLWELRSSARVYARYFGGGRVSGGWLRNRIRILLGGAVRGRNPLPGIRVLCGAALTRVKPVEPPLELSGMLFGSPLDMPLPRPEPGGPGPGWRGEFISPWAGSPAPGGDVSLRLFSTGHAVSGAILDSGGRPLSRFNVPAGGSTDIRVAPEGDVFYIKCDGSGDQVKAVFL